MKNLSSARIFPAAVFAAPASALFSALLTIWWGSVMKNLSSARIFPAAVFAAPVSALFSAAAR